MEENDNAHVGRVRARDNDDPDDHDRRERQRLLNHVMNNPVPRPEPFAPLVPLSIENIRVHQSSSLTHQSTFEVDPRYHRLKSLKGIVAGKSTNKHIHVFQIVSISPNFQSDSTNPGRGSQRNYNNQRSGTYTRKIILFCPKSPVGQNVFCIYDQKNSGLFSYNGPSSGYNGDIRKFYSYFILFFSKISSSNDTSFIYYYFKGPGAWVIFHYLTWADGRTMTSRSDVPVITPSKNMYVINSNFDVTARMLQQNDNTDLSVAYYKNWKIELQGFQVRQSLCTGQLCDQQELFNNESEAQKCCCQQMNPRHSSIYIVMNLVLSNPMAQGQDSIKVQFISKRFMTDFILTDYFPSGTKLRDIATGEPNKILFAKISNVFRKGVNEWNRFNVLVWSKRGEVSDAIHSSDNGNSYYNNHANETIASGNVKYHLVRIDPGSPEDVDLEWLENNKFDVVRDFSRRYNAQDNEFSSDSEDDEDE